LFFRLEVFPIAVPSLSQRRSDIELLAASFVEAFCRENGFCNKKIEPQVFETLAARNWPGNVRELKNVVERAAILSSDVITIADLPEDPHSSPFDEELEVAQDSGPSEISGPEPSVDAPEAPLAAAEQLLDAGRRTLREVRDAAERAYILQTLQEMDWNVSKTAVALGVERTNLHKKVRAYKIRRDERS
jgi:DNA-binding NtrC family response regulator